MTKLFIYNEKVAAIEQFYMASYFGETREENLRFIVISFLSFCNPVEAEDINYRNLP